MEKRFISSLLILLLLLPGVVYPLRAKALFGVVDTAVVTDPVHTGINIGGWIKDVALKALEIARRIALESLKKRFLDMLVDETIRWIQGDGDPKFVTDFGGFLEDVGQTVVGDVARDVGLGELCTGIRPARIKIQLQQPVFTRQISCTLDNIVGNVNRFRQNFSAGGWVGYQELLKPQNNRWGIEILTQSEVARRKSIRLDASRREITVGSGFLSTKRCLEWTLYGNLSGGRAEIIGTVPVNEGFDYPDSKNPPPIAPGGENTSQEWKCTEERVTTPGRAIAEGLERSLYADIDFLVNAQDLTAYIGAIADAAINRLVREGVGGVANLSSSGGTSQSDCNDPRLTPSAQIACREYRERQGELESTIEEAQQEQLVNLALTNLNATQVGIQATIDSNAELASKTRALADCQAGRGLTCTQTPTLIGMARTLNALNASSTRLDEIEVAVSAEGLPRSLIQLLAEEVGAIRASVDTENDRIQIDITHIESELALCEDETNLTYSCPSPP